jgi:hypothetical protein
VQARSWLGSIKFAGALILLLKYWRIAPTSQRQICKPRPVLGGLVPQSFQDSPYAFKNLLFTAFVIRKFS